MTTINDSIAAFLADYSGVYADITFDVRRRELSRLATHVQALAGVCIISTTDPALLTVDDVKVIAIALKKTDLSVNSRVHMLGRLNLLCKHDGNFAVELAKVRYPTLFPSKRETRLDVLSASDVADILAYADREVLWKGLRAAVNATIPLATGARPQEVRFMRDVDLDLDAGVAYIAAPKAADTWGMPRTVPILPAAVPTIARYVSMLHAKGREGYLFANSKGEPVSGQTQRRWRETVIEGSGVQFDHRILRRTWGQSLIDAGLPEDYVSVLLGHASTETTARYYARVRERQAVRAVQAAWAAQNTKKPISEVEMNEKSRAEAESGEREGFQTLENLGREPL